MVIHLVGVGADRTTYKLLSLARTSPDAANRERYYLAAASARDPAMARHTLGLISKGEIPSRIVSKMIRAIAWEGEQAEAAWVFLQRNFKTLADKQGSSFRNDYIASFMKNFSERRFAVELAGFAPAYATPSARQAAKRAEEDINFAADFKARALPAIDEWIRQRASMQ